MTSEVEINNPYKNKMARIMVVDDEKDILRIIKRDLEITNEFQVEVFHELVLILFQVDKKF